MDDPPTPSIYVFGQVGYITGLTTRCGKGGGIYKLGWGPKNPYITKSREVTCLIYQSRYSKGIEDDSGISQCYPGELG